ncbi:hypothetical protein D3C86_2242680 [compost metagenome]
MPTASTGSVAMDLKVLTPNWNSMPAIMPAARPLGIWRSSLSKEPDRPISSIAAAAVM